MSIRRPALGRSLLIALVALAAIAWSAASASAAGTWLAPATLSTGSAIDWTSAGSAANGDVVAAWARYDGTNYSLELATRPAGGSFTVKTLQSGANALFNVRVSVNEAGAAIVTWARSTSSTVEVWAATRDHGGGFGAPAVIASAPGQPAQDASNAINEDGATIVVWRYTSSSNDTVYAAARAPGAGWGSGQPISSTDPWNQSPRVALDNAGRATIVWSYWDGSSNIARVRVRAADGTLGTQRDLSAAAPTGYPMFATVGVDREGNAVAVWSWWNNAASNAVYEVRGASRPAASDTWTQLPKFGESASASFGSEPQVAVDDSGTAVAIWRAANNTINAASRAPGGAFGAAQLGISAPSAATPRVQFDRDGDAIAIWQRSDGSGARIEASVRPPGGAFGAVKTLSADPSASAPGLGVDGLGNAFAVWVGSDPGKPAASRYSANFAAYDVSAPQLSGVSVPGSATVGDTVGMSAAASDVWSGARLSWDFGDGVSATGPAVDHSFGSPGTYAVTVTATDGLGNSASATRTIAVSAKPPPPPPPPAPPRVLDARVAYRWTPFKTYTTVTRLEVTRVLRGAKITLKCKGTGCPLKTRSITAKKGGTVKLTQYFNFKKKQRKIVSRLKPKTKVTVAVTAPNSIGTWFEAVVQKGKQPSLKRGCLTVGSSTRKMACPMP